MSVKTYISYIISILACCCDGMIPANLCLLAQSLSLYINERGIRGGRADSPVFYMHDKDINQMLIILLL